MFNKVANITSLNSDGYESVLAFTEATRGRIVQVRVGIICVHYFYDEPSGLKMIAEDETRLGFEPGTLIAAIRENAPAKIIP